MASRVGAFVAAELPALAGARALLAVSGGADSCAMAGLMLSGGIVARGSMLAHFDHRLRGEGESRRERQAVDTLAARLRVPAVHGSWARPVPGEAAAREARYAFLRDAALSAGAAGVVTGHTGDDQAETVLMRILRGAGVHGLAGMRADASWPGGGAPLRVWRPLLCLTRDETRAWCVANAIVWHDDPSNDERRYLRNRVRHDVLPAMERCTPDLRTSLAGLALRARAVADATDLAVRAALASKEHTGGSVRLSRDELRTMPPELVPYAFRAALIDLLGDARDVGRVHYAAFARAVAGRTGAECRFPRGLVLRVDADAIVLSAGPVAEATIAPGFERPLPFTGEAGAWRLSIAPVREGGAADIVAPPGAIVRGRRPGDRVKPRGMGGRHRKLQDVLVDRKVPRRLRDAMPVIAVGADVLWTPYGASEVDGEGEAYRVAAAPIGPGVTAHR